MTNKEALRILTQPGRAGVHIIRANDDDTAKYNDDSLQAWYMAIKALEAEPCEDAISRQAVIDTVERWLSCNDYNEAERHIMRAVQSVLYDSPSVTPQPKILALLEKTYNDFCNCDGGEGWLKIDGKEYVTDAGYAIEGVEIFMEILKRRLAESEGNNDRE